MLQQFLKEKDRYCNICHIKRICKVNKINELVSLYQFINNILVLKCHTIDYEICVEDYNKRIVKNTELVKFSDYILSFDYDVELIEINSDKGCEYDIIYKII